MPAPSPYAAQLAEIPVERHEVDVLGGTTAYWVYGPADAETTMLAATFQWLLAQPAVTSVIAGATSESDSSAMAANARSTGSDVRASSSAETVINASTVRIEAMGR